MKERGAAGDRYPMGGVTLSALHPVEEVQRELKAHRSENYHSGRLRGGGEGDWTERLRPPRNQNISDSNIGDQTPRKHSIPHQKSLLPSPPRGEG